MSGTGSGPIDLDSVLKVHRQRLASIPQAQLASPYEHRSTDTIYVKRIDRNSNVMSIEGPVILFGELQLLCSLFGKYTTTIDVVENGRKEVLFIGGGAGNATSAQGQKSSFNVLTQDMSDDVLLGR
ncbi:unnamed protein product [Didymodactylos carnosus]|uniref:Uncharacterized protein n=1 Tax=Didymodactylos carnosus TaxID=1234261 RepID=A0A8S2EA37_9BILA|nr:unnamed protein product [Didymodactylos carnosus]CAF3886966.1 unnamed protein product [Didymodactylos carnosus]